MKPLVLTLQAFGTFKDKVIIDFREFENAGLFLITGPTGSGKTTIFDGLMYALYGMMSGDDRDSTKSVKSQFASEEVECYVELQFVAKQSEYTIRRSPEQRTLGKSKRIIDQKSQVFLKTPDERLTKINEVNNKITEILNLTATQFKQIVLLPQGEFKKLLFASSIEKEAILRSVFNTQEIQRFSDLLKKKSVDISKEVNSTQTKILTLFQSIDNPSEVLQQAIALQDLSEVIELLKQSVQHHQQRLTSNRERESLVKQHISSLEREIYLKN
ncbi:MAG: AAA family ATPase, partial [Erysipelothrix sp.]|nr:AAA family ATPase [Erysipelothrix sp.]